MIRDYQKEISDYNSIIEKNGEKIEEYLKRQEKITAKFYTGNVITPSSYEEEIEYCELNVYTCRKENEKLKKKVAKLEAKERKRTKKFKKYNPEKEQSNEETNQPGQE